MAWETPATAAQRALVAPVVKPVRRALAASAVKAALQASVAKAAKKRLTERGLDWSGKLRIFTDAKVLSHNATTVKKNKRLGDRFMTYTWDIKNIFAPTSSMVIQIY